jgi:acyl carrier protein
VCEPALGDLTVRCAKGEVTPFAARGMAHGGFWIEDLDLMNDIVQRVRHLLATRLKLAKAAEEIGDDTPLFGPAGLGLDSIDALELVLGLEKEFGVVIEDRAVAIQVLTSIQTIAEFIQSKGKG